jgi:hypothetical protein
LTQRHDQKAVPPTIVRRKEEGNTGQVLKLLNIRVIGKVQFPEWLANVIMALKKNGKRRMCIDFTILNKAYLKDE